MAASALRSTSAGCTEPLIKAMPMLTPTRSTEPPKTIGSARLFGDPVAQCLGRAEAERVGDDDELVAAEPTGRVALAHDGVEPLGKLGQHLVADQVAALVVDGLEVVEVAEQQRAALTRGGGVLHHLLQA